MKCEIFVSTGIGIHARVLLILLIGEYGRHQQQTPSDVTLSPSSKKCTIIPCECVAWRQCLGNVPRSICCRTSPRIEGQAQIDPGTDGITPRCGCKMVSTCRVECQGHAGQHHRPSGCRVWINGFGVPGKRNAAHRSQKLLPNCPSQTPEVGTAY